MAKTTSSSSFGIGFVGLLTIVFITLKLLGKTSWSWWWILSPVWITIVIIIIAIISAAVYLINKECR